MLNYQRVLSFQLMLFAESTTLASKEFGDMLDMRRTTVARGVKVLYWGGTLATHDGLPQISDLYMGDDCWRHGLP